MPNMHKLTLADIDSDGNAEESMALTKKEVLKIQLSKTCRKSTPSVHTMYLICFFIHN